MQSFFFLTEKNFKMCYACLKAWSQKDLLSKYLSGKARPGVKYLQSWHWGGDKKIGFTGDAGLYWPANLACWTSSASLGSSVSKGRCLRSDTWGCPLAHTCTCGTRMHTCTCANTHTEPLAGWVGFFQLTGMSWTTTGHIFKTALTRRVVYSTIWPSGFLSYVGVSFWGRVLLSGLGWLWVYSNPPVSASPKQTLQVCAGPTRSGLGFSFLIWTVCRRLLTQQLCLP